MWPSGFEQSPGLFQIAIVHLQPMSTAERTIAAPDAGKYAIKSLAELY
jgi:hypothetical protein